MSGKIVIAFPVRTAIGRASRDGFLRNVPAQELLKECFKQVISRSGIDPVIIDQVIAGTCFHLHDAPDVARVSALLAGVPEHVPGYAVQRNCASGLQAITCAVNEIRAREGEIYLVGGTESMSNFPYVIRGARWGLELRDGVIEDTLWRGLTDPLCGEHMGKTAESVAEKYGVSRKAQDEFSVSSHRKALRAQREGKFKSQIIPIAVKEKTGLGQTREKIVVQDQCIRPDANAEVMASLPAVFRAREEGGTVTPGNSCPFSDGAAAMLVMTEKKARQLNTVPMAEIVAYTYVGLDPRYMGEGPIPAIRKLLSKVDMDVGQVDFFEINEAFAAQCFPCQKELLIPDEKLNVWGGAVALGHPVGATGSILTVKAAHILKEYDGEYAVISMCVGGGQGGAMLIRNYRAPTKQNPPSRKVTARQSLSALETTARKGR